MTTVIGLVGPDDGANRRVASLVDDLVMGHDDDEPAHPRCVYRLHPRDAFEVMAEDLRRQVPGVSDQGVSESAATLAAWYRELQDLVWLWIPTNEHRSQFLAELLGRQPGALDPPSSDGVDFAAQVSRAVEWSIPNFWIRLLRKNVDAAEPEDVVVVVAVRNPSEGQAIRSMGGVLWGVHAGDGMRDVDAVIDARSSLKEQVARALERTLTGEVFRARTEADEDAAS